MADDATIVIGAKDDTGAAIEAAARRLERLEKIARNSGGQFQVTGKRGAEAMLGIARGAERIPGMLDKVSDAFRRAGERAAQSHRAGQQAAKQHQAAARAVTSELGMMIGRYASLAAAIEGSRRAFMGFANLEMTQRQVAARIGATQKEVEALTKELEKLGQQGNRAPEEMLQGFQRLQDVMHLTRDETARVLPAIVNYSDLTQTSLERNAEMFGELARGLQLSTEGAIKLANSFSALEVGEHGVRLKNLHLNLAELGPELARLGLAGDKNIPRVTAQLELLTQKLGERKGPEFFQRLIDGVRSPAIGDLFGATADGWERQLEEFQAKGIDSMTYFWSKLSIQSEATQRAFARHFGVTREELRTLIREQNTVEARMKRIEQAQKDAATAAKRMWDEATLKKVNALLATIRNLFNEIGGLMVRFGAGTLLQGLIDRLQEVERLLDRIKKARETGDASELLKATPEEQSKERERLKGLGTHPDAGPRGRERGEYYRQRMEEMLKPQTQQEEQKHLDNLRKLNPTVGALNDQLRKTVAFLEKGGGTGTPGYRLAGYGGGEGAGGYTGGGYRPSIGGQMPTTSPPRFAPGGATSPGHEAPYNQFTPQGPGGPGPGQLWKPRQMKDGIIGPSGNMIVGKEGQVFKTDADDKLIATTDDQLIDAIIKQEGGMRPGTLSARNNNPGNVKLGKYSQGFGHTGIDRQGHLIFPTPEAGKAAMRSVILGKYGGRRLGSMGVRDYAEDPNWARSVATLSGLGPDYIIGSGTVQAPLLGDMVKAGGGERANISMARTGRGSAPNLESYAFSGATPAVAGSAEAAVDEMMQFEGLTENRDREALLSYINSGGKQLGDIRGRSNAWCAAILNRSLARQGIRPEGTNLAAGSYRDVGTRISADQAKKGDIFVVPGRGGASKGIVHTGLVTGGLTSEGKIPTISGNTSGGRGSISDGGMVGRRDYTPSSILINRLPERPAARTVLATRRASDRVAGPGGGAGKGAHPEAFASRSMTHTPATKPGASLSTRAHRGAPPPAPAPKPVPATPIAPATPAPKPATKINDAMFFPGGGKAPVQPHPQDHALFTRKNPMLDRGPAIGDWGGSHLQQRTGFARFSDRLRVLREARNTRIGSFADIGLG